jgi:hypothetical protein
MKTFVHLWQYLLEFFVEWDIFQTKFVEKVNAHILCSVFPPPPESRAVYELMWKNVVQPDRPQMTI